VDEVVSLATASELLPYYEGVWVILPISSDHSFQKFVLYPLHCFARNRETRGQGWVSLRQNKKIFNIFVGKVKSFKECFFLVWLRTEAAFQNILTTIERPRADGGVTLARVPFFPFYWFKTTSTMSPTNLVIVILVWQRMGKRITISCGAMLNPSCPLRWWTRTGNPCWILRGSGWRNPVWSILMP